MLQSGGSSSKSYISENEKTATIARIKRCIDELNALLKEFAQVINFDGPAPAIVRFTRWRVRSRFSAASAAHCFFDLGSSKPGLPQPITFT